MGVQCHLGVQSLFWVELRIGVFLAVRVPPGVIFNVYSWRHWGSVDDLLGRTWVLSPIYWLGLEFGLRSIG